MNADNLPVQVAEIKKDVEYLRREHDRAAIELREDAVEQKDFRKEVRRRLLALENASIGVTAVAGSKETSRTRITWIAALLFGASGMTVGILSVVLR